MEWESAAQKARSGELTVAQARKVLAEIVASSTGESLNNYTVESWLSYWIENKAGSASENTMHRYRQVTRDFLHHLGGRSSKSLAGVSPKDVVSFRDSLYNEGRAASTCNTVVKKILSVPFESARKLGYIPTNPVSAVDLLKTKRDSSPKEPFSRGEVSALLKHAEGDWYGAIILAVTSGQRLGDITNLRYSSLDLKGRTALIQTQKTGEQVTVMLQPDFMIWIEGRPIGIGMAPIFPSLVCKKINGAHGLSQQFRKIMETAEITEKVTKAKGSKGRTRNSKGFHSFRHTFTSNLANAGVSAEIRQVLSGHRDPKVHAKYTHLDQETMREAAAKLPRLNN
jgi:integrase